MEKYFLCSLVTYIFYYIDFQTRCPYGKKTKFYKKVKVEKFCDYLNKDGLVLRISIANDIERKI